MVKSLPRFLLLLSVIPAATATLLYWFIGAFMPSNLLVAAAASASCAGLLLARH